MNDFSLSSAKNAAASRTVLGQAQAADTLAAFMLRQVALSRRLEKFSLRDVIGALAGLLTVPDNHPNTMRLELLIHVAAILCRGREAPSTHQFKEWLNKSLKNDWVVSQEDPIEDVFVANVVAWGGNARLFEGIFEGNSDYLQPTLAAVSSIDKPWAKAVRAQVTALLTLSDAVAQKGGTLRNTTSTGQPRQKLRITSSELAHGIRRVTFGPVELDELGIDFRFLKPFTFRPEYARMLPQESLGHTALERRPLLVFKDEVILALPTAISASIRRYILERAAEEGAMDELAEALRKLQLEESYRVAKIGWKIELIEPAEYRPKLGIDEVVGRFDDDSYVHFILVHDVLSGVNQAGLASPHTLTHLDAHIEAATQRLAARPGYRRGMTLLVHGGVGRGFFMGLKTAPSNWQRLVMGIHDFSLLGWDHECTALRAWKLLEQEDRLRQRGIEIFNLSGYMNFYAYAQKTGYSLLPDNETPNLIHINGGFAEGLRTRLRQRQDRHAVRMPEGKRWIEVQRRTTSAFFKELQDAPIYVSPQQIDAGVLAGCVTHPNRTWWVDGKVSSLDVRTRSVEFKIWDLVLNWTMRLAPVFEARGWSLSAPVASIRVELVDADRVRESALLKSNSWVPPVINCEDGIVNIICSPEYIGSFVNSKNVGDRLMVKAIVEGARKLLEHPVDDAEVDAVLAIVIPNDEARFFHTLPAHDPVEVAQAVLELPEPRFVQEEDQALSRLWIADVAEHKQRGVITFDKAQSLLHRAVDVTWSRMHALLAQLDRRSVVERALTNAMSCEMDRLNWRQTAAALRALHEDSEDVIRTANHRESQRAIAALASRAVVEMAICTSPSVGGMACGVMELDKLLSEVSTMLECASQSDAIRYGLVTREPIVNAHGWFEFDEEFIEVVQRPYRHTHGQRVFLSAADDYGANFEEPRSTDVEIDPAFLEAFTSEFGIGIEDYFKFSAIIAHECIRRELPVVQMTKRELISLLQRELEIEASVAERTYDAFALKERSRWDQPKPANALARDWYPWRFNRRLSLVRRPIVELGGGEDDAVLISATGLENTGRYLCGAFDARLPAEMFSNEKMIRWIGAAAEREGHKFNEEVASRLREMGFAVRVEVKMTELGGSDEQGDVDVIAWCADPSIVYIVESKRLFFSRTVGEIGERLREYTDVAAPGEDRTPIQKHLDRVAFLKGNLKELALVVGKESASIDLRSVLVTDYLVPMQFSKRMLKLVDGVTDLSLLDKVVVKPRTKSEAATQEISREAC